MPALNKTKTSYLNKSCVFRRCQLVRLGFHSLTVRTAVRIRSPSLMALSAKGLGFLSFEQIIRVRFPAESLQRGRLAAKTTDFESVNRWFESNPRCLWKSKQTGDCTSLLRKLSGKPELWVRLPPSPLRKVAFMGITGLENLAALRRNGSIPLLSFMPVKPNG